jgi:hypothetical protein
MPSAPPGMDGAQFRGSVREQEIDPLPAERLIKMTIPKRGYVCCLGREQSQYTRTTQALPGGGRS